MDCNGNSGNARQTGAKQLAVPQQLGSRSWINRTEYIRLLEQALQNLGFGSIARQLEAESGVLCQSSEVVALEGAVLSGSWDKAVGCLDRLRFSTEDERKQAKFFVLEQKYLEALGRRDWMSAVKCLRTELSPLDHSAKRVQCLASCILCNSPLELEGKAAWSSDLASSRQALLVSLQSIVPPDVMLPHSRLEVLVEQAIEAQLTRCLYHNTSQVSVSLLSDYKCGREQIPTCTTQVLLEHEDEVWHVQFSHNGQMLATASKDSSAMIWAVRGRRSLVKKFKLTGHTQAITFLSWSPDDAFLATCGTDGILKLWDSSTGQCHRSLNHHSECVTCMAWLPDGKRIISGSSDKQMIMCDTNGNQIRTWKRRRVHDMAVTADGSRVLTINSEGPEHRVQITHLQGEWEDSILESDSILSLSLSQDNRFLLVNLKNQEIHLWPLPALGDPMPTAPLVKYTGLAEKTGRFVVRSCFGGFQQAFVLSGSEESKVYIWHRDTGELLAELEEHSGTVNAVTWNPTLYHMFASASDDKSVHIWSVSDEVADAAGLT